MDNRELAAIDAVIKRFPDVGKGVVVDVITLKRRTGARAGTGKPRLRFDKVVVRLTGLLQQALGDAVPDGITVALTVTAPIRVAAKTGAALEIKIKSLLERQARRDTTATIHGNRVRIRFLRDKLRTGPKMIGFVHHADSDPVQFLDMTSELLDVAGAYAGQRTSKRDGDRWLVVASPRARASLEAYRYIYSQLRVPADFKKTLMVFGDGRVEMLKG